MSRIARCFERLRKEKKQALIPYIVAGDPVPDITVEVMHQIAAAGADIIELGVPFTDPEAEGQVIQLAHDRALKHQTSLADCIAMVASFREQNLTTPVLLMGYANPIEAMGYETFAARAAAAGVDANLLVNVPPEEGELLQASLGVHQLDTIYLLAPTTSEKRARFICSRAGGFIYYVSLKGTTGASTLNMDAVQARVEFLKPLCPVPLVVGFGIKDGTTAARVARFADGVVVGSALVNIFAQYQAKPTQIALQIAKQIGAMRRAMDA